ncbi:g3494 [Coccomyxa viridis]|uniref:G3494 protein n=1 Tax=Coccomyxa viridis TaxID=1274662 RepID=A0ABP1FPI5_9CHLO
MPGAVIATSAAQERAHLYHDKLTTRAVVYSAFIAQAGFLFGYDLGITGGVTGMPQFLDQFFPQVARKQKEAGAQKSAYCTFDDGGLQAWTSSMFVAGAITAAVVSLFPKFFQRLGRKYTMMIGAFCFLVGAILQAAAVDMSMLIIGRIFLGIGIGLANQVAPMYISETAPPSARGGLNIMFQLCTTIGILVASGINYGVQNYTWGWRFSLGFACVFALLFFVGTVLAPDSPNSLLLNGKTAKATEVLRKVRGAASVDGPLQAELEDIQKAVAQTQNEHTSVFAGLTTLFKHYPQILFAAVIIPIAQQFTGMNAIMFFAPQIFQVMGMGVKASLMSSMITNAVNMLATFVAIYVVDRRGRKPLFVVCGTIMAAMQIATGILTALTFTGTKIPQTAGDIMIVFICIFVAMFAASWGPLGWLVPSEMHPLTTRTTGQGINVFFNFLASFIIGQFFNTMLCKMQFGVFLFFAGCVMLNTLFAIICLPETKGVPVEKVEEAWHGYPKYIPSRWRFKYVPSTGTPTKGVQMMPKV